jgi:hypothetical protein
MGNCAGKKTVKPISSHNKENQKQEVLTTTNVEDFLSKKITL